MNKLAVVVSTWDGYRKAWPMMAHGIERYWGDCPWPIYWVTNEMDPPLGESIKVGANTEWGYMVRQWLSKVPADYVLYLQEDYWLVEQPDNVMIEEFLGHMIEHGIDHIQLVQSWGNMKKAGPAKDSRLVRVSRNSSYLSSLQPGLWNRKTFLETVVEGESPWQFEIEGTNRLRDRKAKCFGVRDGVWPYKYVYRHLPVYGFTGEAVMEGMWSESAVWYVKHHGLNPGFKIAAGLKVRV